MSKSENTHETVRAAEIEAAEERKAIEKELTALRRELREVQAAETVRALVVYTHLAETGRLADVLAEIEQFDGGGYWRAQVRAYFEE